MVTLKKVYKQSKDALEKEIDGQSIIIPLAKDMMDLDKTLLFTLNDSAKQIWLRINGKNSVLEIVEELHTIYNVNKNSLEKDVLQLLEELAKRKLVLEV